MKIDRTSPDIVHRFVERQTFLEPHTRQDNLSTKKGPHAQPKQHLSAEVACSDFLAK